VNSAAPAPEPESSADSTAERKGQRTRRRILEAAREVFAGVGYDRATIRAIAAVADADKSSVIKYFGTKEALFQEAVHWDIPVTDLNSVGVATTTELTRAMLTAWASDPNSPMAVLLRTSMTSEVAADLLRKHITHDAIDAMAPTIDAPDGRLRAALASAMLMGIASQRYILQLPDLVNVDMDEMLELLAPLLQSLLRPQTTASPKHTTREKPRGVPRGGPPKGPDPAEVRKMRRSSGSGLDQRRSAPKAE
jgi:AcrR family transcriptional regulator